MLTEIAKVPAQFFTGGPCAHTICLAADVEALKGIHGGDLAEVVCAHISFILP